MDILIGAAREYFEYSITPSEKSYRVFECLDKNFPVLFQLIASVRPDQLSMSGLTKLVVDTIGYNIPLYRKPHTKTPDTFLVQVMITSILINSKHFQRKNFDTVDELRSYYNTITFPLLDELNFRLVTEFANVARLLLKLLEGKNHRRLILELGTRATEGVKGKRVMGGGVNIYTLIRDNIICVEGNIVVQPRPSRKQKRDDQSSSDEQELQPTKKRTQKTTEQQKYQDIFVGIEPHQVVVHVRTDFLTALI